MNAHADLAGSRDRAREVLALRRRLRRRHRPRPGAYGLYVAGLMLAIFGPMAYEALASLRVAPASVARWAPAILLLVLLSALRYAVWQGPVVFSAADVAFLLGAPVAQADFVRPKLTHALAAGVAVGVIVALVLALALSAGPRPLTIDRALVTAAGLGALGSLAVAMSWLVQSSRSGARAVQWTTPIVVLVVAGLVVVAHAAGASGRSAALWSGPWGWAVLPAVGQGAAWLAGPVALAACAAAATVLAIQRAAASSTEQFLARADTRTGITASIAVADYRTATLVRRGAVPADRPAIRHLPPPTLPWLALPWRDALAVMRGPSRLAWAIALCAAATWAIVAHPGRPIPTAVGIVALYAAASRLLEPLRADVDSPDTSRLLTPWRFGSILTAHCAVPIATLALCSALSIATLAIAGTVAPSALVLIPTVLVPAVAAAVLCAALSARRAGRLPPEVLFAAAGDPTGGGYVLAWLALWPIIAVLAIGAPTLVVGHAITHHRSLLAPVALQLAITVITAAILSRQAWRSRAPD